jgi:hypothetical protein
MPDELWEKLVARDLKNDGIADQRLQEERFLDGHEGGLIWEVVARAQQKRAERDAKRRNEILFYSQAVDTPTRTAAALDKDTVHEALQVVSLTGTGYLMGMAPLFIGMHVRLSATVKKVPLLVREVTGIIANFDFDPLEPRHHWGTREVIVLKYLPQYVYIRLDDPEMANTKFLPGCSSGVIRVSSVTSKWTFKQSHSQSNARGHNTGMEMERKQIPLAPATVNTHYGLQGQTARKGMIAWVDKPTEMSQGDYFLALYVMLSRPTKLDDLLIVGLPDRSVFENGIRQLPALAARIAYYEEKALADIAVADRIMRDELRWYDASNFPLA